MSYYRKNRTPSPQTQEIAREEGMLHGVEAYNDAMGYSLAAPGPCGHHCDSYCPRCGEEAQAAWYEAQRRGRAEGA